MRVFKRLRFYLRYFIAITRRYYLIIFFSSLLGVFVALSLTYIANHSLFNRLKVIKYGMVGQFTTSNLPNEVLTRLSFGLTKIQDNGEVVPGISEKWTISPDGKQYEFFIIAEKYNWNNGQPFSMYDLNYSFQDVSIATTNRSIIFSLKEEYSPLPAILSKPVFLSQLVGLGDYRVTRINNKGNIIDNMFLKYIGSDQQPDILYSFYPTVTDMIIGFNMGEIDNLSGLHTTNGISLGQHVKIDEYTDYNIYTALFFNTNKPEFSDKTVRQALAYAINKPTDDKRAISPYSPKSWVFNSNIKLYIYDTIRSFELVSKTDEEKTREIAISAFPQDIGLAQNIVTDWQTIGIKSKVETINVIPEDFDVLLVNRQTPFEIDQYDFWHSTQPGNLSKMRNPRLDKLLEDGRKTSDRELRKNIYLDFQRFLLEECPAVFISHPTLYRVSRI